MSRRHRPPDRPLRCRRPRPATAGLRGDTLYVSLGGALATTAALPALNVPGWPVLLGVVEVDATTIQPSLTLDGVGTLAAFPTSFVNTAGVNVATPVVQIGGGYNAPSDYDVDARSDDLDNCPFTANTDQLDRGGLITFEPDGTGDLCQCGESTGDGAIFAADTAVVRQLLAGLAVSQPLLAQARCSVSGSSGCDVADAAILRRSLLGLLPAPLTACESAVR